MQGLRAIAVPVAVAFAIGVLREGGATLASLSIAFLLFMATLIYVVQQK